jgi:hypothetical protein
MLLDTYDPSQTLMERSRFSSWLTSASAAGAAKAGVAAAIARVAKIAENFMVSNVRAGEAVGLTVSV